MAHRRGKKAARAEEEHQKRLKETRKKQWKAAKIAVVLAIIILVVFGASPFRPANPTNCFPNGEPNKLVFNARLFIWVGEPVGGAGDEFIYINSNIGRGEGCRWPVTTGPESPTCTEPNDWNAERCADWVTVHVASPVVHQYTLGDFFRVWAASPGLNRTGQSPVCSYFGPDGVCGTAGPTFVSYNYGEWVTADPSMAFHPQDRIDIKVLPT